MVVDGGCVVPAHASPIFIAPQVGLLTARHWNLVPELGSEPLKGASLGHGKGYLHPFHKGLDVFVVFVAEVAGFKNGLIIRICTSQADSASGFWPQKHGNH